MMQNQQMMMHGQPRPPVVYMPPPPPPYHPVIALSPLLLFSSLLFKELSFWMLRSLCVFYRKIHIIKAESNNPMVMTDEMMLLVVKDVNEPTRCLGLHSSSFCLSLTQLLKTIFSFLNKKNEKKKK